MKALSDVVLFKIDAEKGEGPDLKKEFAVQGYPTYVLTNSHAASMDRWTGYEKNHFVTNLADALSDPTTMDEKRARFASNPTQKDAGKLGRYHGTRGDYREAVEFFKKADSLGDQDYTFAIFDNVARGANEDVFSVRQAEKAARGALIQEDQSPENVAEIYSRLKWLGNKKDQPDLATPYLAQALEATANSDSESLQRRHRSLAIEHAVKVEKNADHAWELKVASMPENWKEDGSQLNAFAWWCFENQINLAEAEVLARKGVELLPAGSERAQVLDTAAEICNARGNCDDAVELIQAAIDNHPESKFYKEQLERFQKIRSESAN